MFIHMDHRLIAFKFLIHIDLKLSDRDQIPSSEVIKVHDAWILSVVIIEHGPDQVFIADGHVHEVLPVPRSYAAWNVQVMLIEV